MLIGIPWELAAVDPTSHMLLPRTLGESLNQATVSPVSLKNRVVSKAFHGQSYLISPQLLLFHSSFHLPSLNSFSKHSPLCGGGKTFLALVFSYAGYIQVITPQLITHHLTVCAAPLLLGVLQLNLEFFN